LKDFQKGYDAGWAANDEFRKDRRELELALNYPGSSLFMAGTLTVFGGLFLVANIIQWVRWNAADFWLWMFAIAPLTGAFLMFRSRPKAKHKAEKARSDFNRKWGNS
jgi:hypothetical protein